MKSFGRHSTYFTISNIWEFYSYNKFNFDPPYQRNSDIWNEEKQSFLIDSIVKNFPLPPIFLHEHVDSASGVSCYDVIDGKQRLKTIIKFIENKLTLPEDCSADGFISPLVDGKRFNELNDELTTEIKKSFWRYQITIEFIESDEQDVIDNIFDRLNRNGEPLNPQELRNAKYHSDLVFQKMVTLSSLKGLSPYFAKLDSVRKEEIEFCSELFFTLVESKVIDSNREQLNQLYEKYCSGIDEHKDRLAEMESLFKMVVETLIKITEGFSRYYIYSVSHLYAIWCLAWQCVIQKADVKMLNKKLPSFYDAVKRKDENSTIQKYIESMQQATKSQTSRLKRVNALLEYMGLETI